jgi:hypothetical protein
LKRRIFLFVLIILTMLSAGCGKANNNTASSTDDSHYSEAESLLESATESSAENSQPADTVKPRLIIASAEAKVRINQGEEFDLLSGITATDNVDGNMKDKVNIDKGNFDPNVPGEYTITYTLSDSAGNQANPVSRTIIVRDSTVLEPPPVFTGAIEGEVLNPPSPALFGGAWYYKVVSSKDKWVGIEATVTLPEVTIRRYNGDYNQSLDVDPGFQNLDNPSVYMGGYAYSECDVGLSFSKALVDVKSQTLSKGSIAFRPFWRYITSENQDAGGYDAHDGEYAVSVNGKNCIANYHWKYTEFYYLPGDKLRIIIYIPEPNKMQLQIEVIEKSSLPSSVEIREKYGWKDPANFKSPIFHTPGQGTDMNAEFKRVNAIDQVANEGKTAIPTDSRVSAAVWHETYLYRKINGVIYRVPMAENRRAATKAPKNDAFTISYEGVDSAIGGEIVSIHPGTIE